MKSIIFSEVKNKLLKSKRGVGFEIFIKIIKKGENVHKIKHPNKLEYPRQKIYLVQYKDHIFLIPFVEEKSYIFLKTAYPSSKYTRKLLKVNKISK
jgi:hypothetical protein